MRCSIADCDNSSLARGLCAAHYRRWRIDGDPTAGGPLRTKPGSLIKWMHNNVGHVGADCLLWPFSRDPRGYGQINVNGKRTGAHRVMCELAHGNGGELEAAHKCGNVACVNPDHLRWATRLENEEDKIAHGTRPKGEKSGSAKLTESQVREIFSLKGKVSQTRLAKHFGVSTTSIERIHCGRSWRHLGLVETVIIQECEEGLAA